MKTIVATFDADTRRRHRFVINEGQPEWARDGLAVGKVKEEMG